MAPYDLQPLTFEEAGLSTSGLAHPLLPPGPAERASGLSDSLAHHAANWERDWIDLGGEG